DPGRHEIAAAAPGYRPWSTTVALAPGATVAAIIPELAIDPDAPRSTPAASDAVTPPWRWLALGLAIGGTSVRGDGGGDLIAGARVVAAHPLPYGAVRATLQGLYARYSPDPDQNVDHYWLGLGLDYVLPWAEGVASAAGIGGGIDLRDS